MPKHAKMIGGPRDGTMVTFDTNGVRVTVLDDPDYLLRVEQPAPDEVRVHQESYREMHFVAGQRDFNVLVHESILEDEVLVRLLDRYVPLVPAASVGVGGGRPDRNLTSRRIRTMVRACEDHFPGVIGFSQMRATIAQLGREVLRLRGESIEGG